MQNINFSIVNNNISLNSMGNKEKNEQPSDELKNPYLKKNDVPELEFIGKNDIIICDKKEYKIKDYFKTRLYIIMNKYKSNLNIKRKYIKVL